MHEPVKDHDAHPLKTSADPGTFACRDVSLMPERISPCSPASTWKGRRATAAVAWSA